jgi:branched-chain amino acid aminotransferase
MINANGILLASDADILANNRAFLYGDGVFETLKIVDNKILFFEDHYFRLMSSMRIVRMEIPMEFTMEFLERQILALAEAANLTRSSRIRFTVYRNEGGFYLPRTNTVSYLINVAALPNRFYQIENTVCEVDLYKDFYITKQLLSSIKSTNKLLNITGSIYAKENGLDNCLVLNDSKNVAGALQGNLFMLTENKLITPPVSEGCLNGVMRRQVLGLAKKMENIEVIESIISPFDLQKADELFITNVIRGIQPITKYRKKEFSTQLAKELILKLNAFVGLD